MEEEVGMDLIMSPNKDINLKVIVPKQKYLSKSVRLYILNHITLVERRDLRVQVEQEAMTNSIQMNRLLGDWMKTVR